MQACINLSLGLIKSDDLLSFHIGYKSDNHLSNQSGSQHYKEVYNEELLLGFRINADLGSFAPSKIITAQLDLINGPFIVGIDFCAEVEVVSVGPHDSKVISVYRPILDQLTQNIHYNVDNDDDQIH